MSDNDNSFTNYFEYNVRIHVYYFFVAVLTVAFDRFSIDKAVLDDFVRVVARGDLTKDAAKRVLWAMLYADDAGIASQSQASLEKMMTAIVEVCAAFGLIVSEKKTVTMHMRPPP